MAEDEARADATREAKPITAEEARLAIEADRRERAATCQRELAEVLAKHRCRLDVSVLLREGQVIPQVAIVPND